MFTVTEVDAPSAWASYLLNNDNSGLDVSEIAACDAWLAENKPDGAIIGIQDQFFNARFDGLLTELATYEFFSP